MPGAGTNARSAQKSWVPADLRTNCGAAALGRDAAFPSILLSKFILKEDLNVNL
jgi:hypothetical protein